MNANKPIEKLLENMVSN